jgi:hypothetical protein
LCHAALKPAEHKNFSRHKPLAHFDSKTRELLFLYFSPAVPLSILRLSTHSAHQPVCR